jgi:hypothetical protein
VKFGTSTGTLTQAANQFTPGNLIVTRVGTGSGALGGNGTATFIDEYGPTNSGQTAPVNSAALPTTGTSFTLSGSTTTEGYVTSALDGHTASVGGYMAAAGSSTTSAVREIGVVNPNGSVESSTQIASADTGSSIRAVASADGLGFWVATANFVRYVPFGNSNFTPTSAVSNFFPSPTVAQLSPQGQLYVDGGAGAQSNGVPAIDGPALISSGQPNVGSNLPDIAGQTGSVLQGFPTSSQPNGFPTPNQFAVSPDGNTIFVADSRTNAGGGILEFYQATAGQWTDVNASGAGFPIGTAGADSGLRGLYVDFSNPNAPIIYGTTTATSANRLVKITGGTTNGNTPNYTVTVLATAPTNEAFRGVALAPTAPGATASSTNLSVSGSPGSYDTGFGKGVTLSATVTGSGLTPTGMVSFRSNGVEFAVAPLVNGSATFVTPGNLGAGTYNNLVAVYTGNGTYAASSSAAKSATVTKFATGVTLTETFKPVAAGFAETLTATLSIPVGTAPTGTVTFWDVTNGSAGSTNSINLGTVSVTQTIVNQGGNPVIVFSAVLSTSFTALGTRNLSAIYSGDANFGTATGTDTLLVVNPTITVVTTSDPNPTASPSKTITLTATVTSVGGTPTGTVQFYDNLLPIGSAATLNGSGVAKVTVSTALLQAAAGLPDVLTPGLHSISAVYTPDTAGANTFFTSTGVYEQAVKAQAFGANDEFVYRVGDGTTPLIAPSPSLFQGIASIGSTIFIDEYAPPQLGTTWTLVQSVILPSADGTGAQAGIHAVVGNGQQSPTGQMSLSGDGQFLFVAGYDTNPLNVATAAPVPSPTGNAAAANATPRGVARIRPDGVVETMGFTGIQSGGNFNGVYSPDGVQLWLSGSGGVSYIPGGFAVSPDFQTVSTTVSGGFTGVGLQNNGGNLVVIGGSAIVSQYIGLPTSSATRLAAPGLPGSDTVQSFPVDVYFTHLNGSGAPAGNNTMYVSDDGPSFAGGHITKWALNVQNITSLSENGTTVSVTTSSALGLVNGETVQISGASPSGYNGTFVVGNVSGSSFTYTAAANLGTVTQMGTGSAWSLVDTLTAGSNNTAITFYWLSGKTDGNGNVALYSTYGNGGNSDAGPGYLYSIIDQNGWNAPIGTGGLHSDAVNQLAAVGSNDGSGMSTTSAEVIRGVAATPVALPVSVVSVKANGSTASVTISNATSSGTTATVTTTTPHEFFVGEPVTIAGVSVSGYNGVFTVTSVTNPTTFTYTTPGSDLGSGTGGTAKSSLAGAQHSMIDSIYYTFNRPVNLAAGAFSIALTPNISITDAQGNTSSGTVGTIPTLSYVSPDGGLTWVVTFSGNGVVNGSIADGVYDITLDHTKVSSAAGASPTSDQADEFFRMFGNTTGGTTGATVSNTDYRRFAGAFGSVPTDANYLAYFDYFGGSISNSAYRQFARRFGVVWSNFNATI